MCWFLGVGRAMVLTRGSVRCCLICFVFRLDLEWVCFLWFQMIMAVVGVRLYVRGVVPGMRSVFYFYVVCVVTDSTGVGLLSSIFHWACVVGMWLFVMFVAVGLWELVDGVVLLRSDEGFLWYLYVFVCVAWLLFLLVFWCSCVSSFGGVCVFSFAVSVLFVAYRCRFMGL